MFDDEDQKTLFTVAFLAKAAVNRKTFNNYKNLFEKLKVFFFFFGEKDRLQSSSTIFVYIN